MKTVGELADGGAEDWFGRQTPLGLLAKVVGIIVALGIVFSLIGWLGGWFSEGQRVTGPANVSAQYGAVIDDWQSLITEAQNACDVTVKTNSDSPTFVEDPALAYKAQFRNTRTDYNRRMQNIFEAKLVGPRGYPRTVPVLPTDWCRASQVLQSLHS